MSPVPRPRRRDAGDTTLLYGLLVLSAWALRVAQLGDLVLVRDEAYFYQWGQHLDWAYYDHPAGIGVLAWLSTTIAGHSEFGVRWLNALVGTLCVVLTFWLGRVMFARKTGLLAASAVALGAPYIVTSRLLYTDPLHLASLLLTLGMYWQLVRRRGNRLSDGLALGLSLAFMVNTKYTAYLAALALAAATLLDHRDILRRPATWLAVGLGILGLVPVLAWNVHHDWASFSWQLSHLTLTSPGTESTPFPLSLARNLVHAATFFSWPLALLALAGLFNLSTPARRLLLLVALAVLGPVVVSPANSPRNLTTGAVPLLLLAADIGVRIATDWDARWLRLLVVVPGTFVGLSVALYGLGTTAALLGAAPELPQSSIVQTIRDDAAGWATVATQLPGEGTIMAVDYSLAGNLAYYTDRPVTTAWPQYRLWGIPDLDEVLVVAWTYLPADLIETRIASAYERHASLSPVLMGCEHGTKLLRLWSAEGLNLLPEVFLDRMDFLTLLAEAG